MASGFAFPPALLGHSLGGVVVQKYLEQFSAPAAVLLASSPIQGMLGATLRQALRSPGPVLKTLLTLDMLPARRSFEQVLFSQGMPRDQVQRYFDRMGNESIRAFIDIALFDKPRPGRIRTSVLVLAGEQDPSIPLRVNEALALAYNTRLETFPVAHDMMLDRGWESVAERIVGWLGERGF